VWLTRITLNDLVVELAEMRQRPIYLFRDPLIASESQPQVPSPPSKPIPTARLLTRSLGVWVPPIGFLTRGSERLFDSTPSGLPELWFEITATLLKSRKPK